MTHAEKIDSGEQPLADGKLREQVRASVFDCRILIVDDDELIRFVIQNLLGSAGFRNVELVENGRLALEIIPEYQPDLIVLDILMPEMDGFDVLTTLRKDPAFCDLPILIQTALNSAEDRNKAFSLGATDLVTKPLNGTELVARVRIHLENNLLIQNLENINRRLDQDLAVASDMQQLLLPEPEALARIERTLNLDIAASFVPSSELGGDFWGTELLKDGRLALFIVDFSGHGISSALNTFRMHALMAKVLSDVVDPADYLETLNGLLFELLPRGQYATMFYGLIDPVKNILTYSAAGSPEPLLGRQNNPDFTVCDTSGMPLGLSRRSRYDNRQVPFPPGSFLFLFSDALSESPSATGEILDDEGVYNLVRSAIASDGQGGAENPLQRILSRFRKHATFPLPDDLTAIWLARHE